MAAKYEIKKARNGQFYFHLKAANGEVILSSETYKAKEGAINGIESVKKNSANDAMYTSKKSVKGEPFFVLKAQNGEIIAKSEMYSSASAVKKGIGSVKRNAPGARVVDAA